MISEDPPLKEPHWYDWHWQFKNRVQNLKIVNPEAVKRFPMAITPYYLNLIKKFDETDPIFSMSIPSEKELIDYPFLVDDPLNEEGDMPVPHLVHRYPDRALLLVTSMCAMYCRHCTRKRMSGQREWTITYEQLNKAVTYLSQHPEIHDVIISGGDPFTLATETLEKILVKIKTVPSIDIIRIGSRVPVTMPMRINDKLVSMLKKYHPIWVNTHFNHPNELTTEAIQACNKLINSGIPLGNQTVLLRGINDNPETMMTLCGNLVKNRIRPYYLFQCDLVRGVEHFRTPISKGVEIMSYLRGRLSGLAIPTFVVDTPEGGGKVPILPNYILNSSEKETTICTPTKIVTYPDPVN
jgi:lysine 2,3-aminomutase